MSLPQKLKPLFEKGRPELFTLLLIGLVAGSVWVFLEVADEVVEGSTKKCDTAILLAFRAQDDPEDPLGPRWVEEVGRDFTALGGVGVLLLLTATTVGYLLLDGRPYLALLAVFAVAGGLVMSLLLKNFFDRPRPDLVTHGSYGVTSSFPSGHSMMSAVVYLTLGALLARTQAKTRLKFYLIAVALFFTVLVGISRVYLGVHWPTDVLAGWAAGATWAIIVWIAARLLQTYWKVEPEDEPAT